MQQTASNPINISTGEVHTGNGISISKDSIQVYNYQYAKGYQA
jgi:hypothetical protein